MLDESLGRPLYIPTKEDGWELLNIRSKRLEDEAHRHSSARSAAYPDMRCLALMGDSLWKTVVVKRIREKYQHWDQLQITYIISMACSNAQQENVSEYFGLPSKIIFDKRTKLEGKTKADILEGHIGGLICDREEDKTKKWLKPMVQKIADYHARKVRETPLLAFVGQDLKNVSSYTLGRLTGGDYYRPSPSTSKFLPRQALSQSAPDGDMDDSFESYDSKASEKNAIADAEGTLAAVPKGSKTNLRSKMSRKSAGRFIKNLARKATSSVGFGPTKKPKTVIQETKLPIDEEAKGKAAFHPDPVDKIETIDVAVEVPDSLIIADHSIIRQQAILEGHANAAGLTLTYSASFDAERSVHRVDIKTAPLGGVYAEAETQHSALQDAIAAARMMIDDYATEQILAAGKFAASRKSLRATEKGKQTQSSTSFDAFLPGPSTKPRLKTDQ